MTSPSPDFDWNRPPSFLAYGAALRARREHAGLTLDSLARATGISKPYLSNIETARAPGPPSEEKIRLIAAALDLPHGPLLTGADWLRAPASMRQALSAATAGGPNPPATLPRRADGTLDLDALLPTQNPQLSATQRPKSASRAQSDRTAADPLPFAADIPLRSIPLINRVTAGRPGDFTDLNYPAGIADQYVLSPDLPDAPAATAFGLRVIGDSMEPEYADGDILIVGPGEPHDGDDCVVRLGELEQFATTFKRIYFVPPLAPGTAAAPPDDPDQTPTAVRLVPLNAAYAERVVPLEHVTGIYPLRFRLVAPGSHRAGRPAPEPAATPAPAPVEVRSFTTPLALEND